MVEHKRPIWMIMPVTFTRLIGGDYYLLAGASKNVMRKYYLAAISLIVILALTCLSILYAMEKLIHRHLIDAILTVFLVGLLGCMYVFLLNTFSKDAKNTHSIVSSANCVRFFFVSFMAFLVSRPLATFLVEERIDKQVDVYKQTLTKEHNDKINAFYDKELSELSGKEQMLSVRLTNFPSTAIAEELTETKDKLTKLREYKTQLTNLATTQIHNANFFLYRLRLGFNHFLSWLVTLIVVVIFLLPAYLIYSIDGEDIYYEQKKNRDNAIVKAGFHGFNESYKKIFKEKWGVDVTYFTLYEDAPFNQIRKKRPSFQTSEQFLDKFYNRNQ